jgi:hypothetical protein
MMKKFERQEIEKAEKLLETIENHPLAKKIRAEEAAETLAKRTAAADRIEALRREAESHGAIQAEIDGMVERLASMDRERSEFLGAINGKRQFLMQERGGIEAGIRHEEQIFYGCYDPAIDEGIEFFRAKLDYLRSPGRISSNSLKGERNLFEDTVTVTAESNEGAVLAALAYCQAAIRELERMKLSPSLDVQIIEEMKKGIPDIGIYTESTGEKPLPGLKGVNPLHLLPSDSEMGWKIGKLNEKFKKLMRRA